MTPAQARKLRRLIRQYAQAKVEDSWKGAQDPQDRPVIEAELKAAKQKLDTFINQQTQEETP